MLKIITRFPFLAKTGLFSRLFRSLWSGRAFGAPLGALFVRFGRQRVPKVSIWGAKSVKKTDFLQNQGKLIWSGKYHTILRVGPSKKALKTVQKGA